MRCDENWRRRVPNGAGATRCELSREREEQKCGRGGQRLHEQDRSLDGRGAVEACDDDADKQEDDQHTFAGETSPNESSGEEAVVEALVLRQRRRGGRELRRQSEDAAAEWLRP